MRKSTIFISAVLTTFALVMLYGVVSAYRNISSVQKASAVTIDTATPEPTDEPAVDPTATRTILTPEQAAQLAAQVVGNTNLLSAESSTINGVDAYLITFTNNDVVYVGLDGQILGVQVAPVVVSVSVPVSVPVRQKAKNNKNANNGGGQPPDNGGEHDN